MSDDLVQRLRDTGPGGGVGAGLSLCREAADRIEALEARNRALEDALQQVDALASRWRTHTLTADIGRIAREALDACRPEPMRWKQ